MNIIQRHPNPKTRLGIFSFLILGIVALPLMIALSVHAEPDNTFSGQVTASDGSIPPGSITITLNSTDNSANDVSTTADSNGDFSLTATPDTYMVNIYHFYFPGGFVESDQTYTSADHIDLTQSNLTQNYELPPMATVGVHVAYADDSPMSRSVVYYMETTSSRPIPSTLNPDGYTVEEEAVDQTDGSGNASFPATIGQTIPADNIQATDQISFGFIKSTSPLTVDGDTSYNLPSGPSPATPANVAISLGSDGFPLLTWDAVPGTTGYRIFRNGENFADLGDSNTTSFDDNTGESTGTYSYILYAHSANGSSLPSQAVTISFTPPPQNLQYQPVGNGIASLSWVSVNGARSYNIYQNGNLLTNVGITGYAFPIMSGSNSYYVTAVSSSGESIASNSVQIVGAPVQPSDLSAPSPTNQYPTLTWPSVPGATSYNIYRDGSKIDSTTTSTYTDPSLTSDGSYTYAITAVSGGAESTPSNSVTVVYDTTPPVVTISGVVNGETYDNPVSPVCNTSDSLSGVTVNAMLSVSNTGTSYTATCSGAIDAAGNVAPSLSSSYTLLPANYTLVNFSNSSGTPFNNARVVIQSASGATTNLTTDSFGNTYLNTTPGTYKVTVYYANGYESQTIRAINNGPNNVVFATVPVSITIVDPNSSNLANASVAQAGNTGSFGAKMPLNGSEQISFQVLPGTNYFTAYDANGYEEQSINVVPSGNNALTFTTYSVEVAVTKNGNPLPTATLKQAGNTGSFGVGQAVNASGQYTFSVLPGTNYFIAYDGPNIYTKQTLNVTGDDSISIAVN